MKRPERHGKPDPERVLLFSLVAIGIVLLVIFVVTMFGGNNRRNIHQENNANLISTEDISTLSVSEFLYNGIAQSLKDNGEPDYNVLYKSSIKVSVDADKIDFNIDDDNKIITFIFPPFTIDEPMIDIDSLSFIPNKENLLASEFISLCKADALEEAKASDKLISSAEDNVKSILEGWYSPIFEGYKFEYQFESAEGGEKQ